MFFNTLSGGPWRTSCSPRTWRTSCSPSLCYPKFWDQCEPSRTHRLGWIPNCEEAALDPPPPHTPYKPFPPTHTNPLAPFGWSCCWTCCWTRSTCYWTRRTITTLATGNRLPRRLPTRRTRRTRRTCRTCRTSSNTFIGRVGRVGRIGRWLPQKSGNRRERNISNMSAKPDR